MTHRVYRHQVTPTIDAGKAAIERRFGTGGQIGGQNDLRGPAPLSVSAGKPPTSCVSCSDRPSEVVPIGVV